MKKFLEQFFCKLMFLYNFDRDEGGPFTRAGIHLTLIYSLIILSLIFVPYNTFFPSLKKTYNFGKGTSYLIAIPLYIIINYLVIKKYKHLKKAKVSEFSNLLPYVNWYTLLLFTIFLFIFMLNASRILRDLFSL